MPRMTEDPVTRITLEAVHRFNEAFDRHDGGGKRNGSLT
jgi:hypothetical protein